MCSYSDMKLDAVSEQPDYGSLDSICTFIARMKPVKNFGVRNDRSDFFIERCDLGIVMTSRTRIADFQPGQFFSSYRFHFDFPVYGRFRFPYMFYVRHGDEPNEYVLSIGCRV